MQATTAQISHTRDTFVLRIAIHKWRSVLVRRPHGASKWRRLMPVQVHYSRRQRLSVGKCTCKRGEKQRGMLICACRCRWCEVCMMLCCAGMHGRAGASCTRAVLCNNALQYASSSAVSSDGRIRSETWSRQRRELISSWWRERGGLSFDAGTRG